MILSPIVNHIDDLLAEKEHFSRFTLINILILSVIYAYQIEFLSKNIYGLFFSAFLAILIAAVTLKRYDTGFFLLLHILIVTPVFPRNLSLFREGEYFFHTIFHDKLLGLTLIQYVFILILIKSIYEIIRRKVHIEPFSKYILLFLIFALTFFIGTLENLFNPLPDNFIRVMISDLKFPFLVIAGIVITIINTQTVQNFNTKLIKVLIFSFSVAAVRAVFFLFSDLINGNINIYFGENAGFILPVFFLLLLLNFEKKIYGYLILLISGLITLPKGRADILFLFILFFIVFLINRRIKDGNIKTMFNRKISIILFSYLIASVALILSANEIITFILNKLDFFTSEIFSKLSASPGIRIVEFENIIGKNIDDGILGLLFGQGAGGYFDFKYTLMEYELGPGSFAPDQLSNRIYYSPHTFVNYFLLKSGLVGLIVYLYTFFILFKHSIRIIDSNLKYLLFLNLPILLWKSFSLPTLSLYLGVLLAIAVSYSNENKNNEFILSA